MLLAILTLSACSPTLEGQPTDAPCPGLDCIDTLTLRAMDSAGAVVPVRGTIGDEDGANTQTFDCTSSATESGAAQCRSDGSADLYAYGRTLRVNIDTADGALGFHGTLSPAWEAPWDSEECGHYCYLATLDVALAPNPVE